MSLSAGDDPSSPTAGDEPRGDPTQPPENQQVSAEGPAGTQGLASADEPRGPEAPGSADELKGAGSADEPKGTETLGGAQRGGGELTIGGKRSTAGKRGTTDQGSAAEKRSSAEKRGSSDKYVPADFGTPPYAPDGPVPRLYAPERWERRRGSLAVGLTVTLAVLVVAGVAVTGINFHLRALPIPVTDPLTSNPATGRPTTHEARPTPQRKPLTHAEFGDRNLGSVPRARKVGGWDHPTCAPLDGDGRVLAANGCDHATQLAYRAGGGGLRAVQLLLAFPTESRAKAAAVSLSKRSSSALRWRRGGTHDRFGYGKVGVGGSGPYVVVTVVTATGPAIRQGPAFHSVLHADTLTRFGGLYAD